LKHATSNYFHVFIISIEKKGLQKTTAYSTTQYDSTT